MVDIIEREWQFDAADLSVVERWLESQPVHAPFAFALGEPKDQVDIYLDTADWRVHRAGFTLRRRAKGDRYEATLKSLDRGHGDLSARREVTEALDGPEILGGDGEVATRVRTIAAAEPLAPLVEVRTRRRPVAVLRHGHAVASVDLDETALLHDGAVAGTLRRVEVEVIEPAIERELAGFVKTLARDCGLTPATTSKFEAALAAASLSPRAALDFGSTVLDPSAGAAEYGFVWLRRHWAEFLHHEPGTRLGEDIEALHQMRVATRRLRATIALFRAVLPARLETLRDELQWAGHELGAVRDLDVQIEGMQALQAAAPEEEAYALAPLVAILEEQRVEERARLIELLDSARYATMVAAMSAALREGPPPAIPPTEVRGFAAPILTRRVRAVRRDGGRLTPGSPPVEFHALRIRGKRLRYSLELFGDLYGRPAQRMTESVKRLQDLLGEHQDADVMIEWLRATVRTHTDRLPPETLVAVGELIARQREIMAARRAAFRPVFREVAGPRWRALERALRERPRPPSPPPDPPAPAVTAPPSEASATPAPDALDAPAPTNGGANGGALSRMRQLFHL
ncbi:MAG: hypothetical protein AMXMBFR23_04860 [Chloroflexota bacterium]